MLNAGLAHRDKICFKFIYNTTNHVEKGSIYFLEVSCRRFCRRCPLLPQSAVVFTSLPFLFCTTLSVFAGLSTLGFTNCLLLMSHSRWPVVNEAGTTTMFPFATAHSVGGVLQLIQGHPKQQHTAHGMGCGKRKHSRGTGFIYDGPTTVTLEEQAIREAQRRQARENAQRRAEEKRQRRENNRALRQQRTAAAEAAARDFEEIYRPFLDV